LACHSKYSSILYRFRDKARYWSKIATFSYPLHSTPQLGGSRRSITIPFGIEKVEKEKKVDDMYSHFDRIPACDGQTDRQADIFPRHSPRYAYASRGNYLASPPSQAPSYKICHFFREMLPATAPPVTSIGNAECVD